MLVGGKLTIYAPGFQVDKAIGTDSCDFLTAPEMDVDDFLNMSASR